MAMTTISALPCMLADGRIGAVGRTLHFRAASACAAAGCFSRAVARVPVIDIEMPFRQDHAAGFHLVHQRQVVGGDDDGGAETVAVRERFSSRRRHRRVDVGGRLVGKQDFRAIDQRACDCGALLLAAGKHGRQNIDAFAKPDPFQQLQHIGLVGTLVLAAHPQRQGHILVGRQMVEEAELLEDDADAPAHQRQLLARNIRDIAAKHADQAAGRLQRQEEKPEKRRLAGARRGPVRNWKDFFGMSKVRSRRISGPIP